jgi:hypothetical protein
MFKESISLFVYFVYSAPVIILYARIEIEARAKRPKVYLGLFYKKPRLSVRQAGENNNVELVFT